MTEKEAREIVKNLHGETLTVNRIDYAEAKGFLEAVEKFRPVIGALLRVAEGTDTMQSTNDALAYFRSNVLGEEA